MAGCITLDRLAERRNFSDDRCLLLLDRALLQEPVVTWILLDLWRNTGRFSDVLEALQRGVGVMRFIHRFHAADVVAAVVESGYLHSTEAFVEEADW